MVTPPQYPRHTNRSFVYKTQEATNSYIEISGELNNSVIYNMGNRRAAFSVLHKSNYTVKSEMTLSALVLLTVRDYILAIKFIFQRNEITSRRLRRLAAQDFDEALLSYFIFQIACPLRKGSLKINSNPATFFGTS